MNLENLQKTEYDSTAKIYFAVYKIPGLTQDKFFVHSNTKYDILIKWKRHWK